MRRLFKSENILLAVCLAFVILVLIGLILQSCRTTSSQLKSERIVQSNTANTEIDDSLALQEFVKRMQSKTFLRVYKFVPIQDSTGQVVGNRLDEVMARWDDAAWCARPENNHPVACLSDAFFNLRRLRAELRESDEYVRVSSGRRTVVVRRGASREFVRQAERFLLK